MLAWGLVRTKSGKLSSSHHASRSSTKMDRKGRLKKGAEGERGKKDKEWRALPNHLSSTLETPKAFIIWGKHKWGELDQRVLGLSAGGGKQPSLLQRGCRFQKPKICNEGKWKCAERGFDWQLSSSVDHRVINTGRWQQWRWMLSAAPAPPSLLFRPHSAHDKRVKAKKINQLLNQLFCSNFPYRPPTRELLLYEPTFSLGGPASRVKSSCQVSTCICQDTAYTAKSERAACKKRGQTGRTQMSKLPNPLIQSLAPRSPRITWCHFILS